MKYDYWLDNTGLSNAKKRALIKEFGTAENVYCQKTEEYRKIAGWKDTDTKKIKEAKESKRIERMWENMEQAGIQFLSQCEKNYPEKLKKIRQPPFGLYYIGGLPKEEKVAAIIGARRCSEYGYYMAKKLGEALAGNGISVISGMAEGIDAAGHKGALQGEGKTYGVLGCGVDICYPAQNRELYETLQKAGGVLSELPPGTPPKPYFFPMRNRMISGLADIVIVVEAKRKSGSLITVDYALEQGKEIYAVPGRATDALSYGCNNLIHQGAGIVLSVEEFLEELEIVKIVRQKKHKNRELCLAKEESLVYSCLSVEPKEVEQILRETSLDLSSVAGILFRLQTMGVVKESFRRYYIEE
ncbi:MAG: DNA-protecting protein DprA [Lachnospiraceae bacterium]|nr:DNA-protecting protein DprA [Lachnospiraceae bacterium]